MSESLKPWLFSHCSTSASSALSGNFDLSDLPFLPGNRIQLLRFLTFLPSPPLKSPSSTSDVWALVGDRTHCIAARFDAARVARFHTDYPLSFTSLKGALLTLTHVRITVAPIKMDLALGEGVVGGYRAGQWGLVLDVRGWEVVSSVAEPVWFGGVKLVTSPNAVPEGEGEKGRRLLEFLKKWVRFQNMQIRAEKERERKEVQQREGNEERVVGGGSGRGDLPTPAQRRRVLVVSSSQVQNSQPPPKSHVEAGKGKERQATQLTQSQEHSGTTFVSPTATKETEGLWNDFDLDADIDVDVEVPGFWRGAGADTNAPSGEVVGEPAEVEPAPVGDSTLTEARQEQTTNAPTQDQAQTQTQTQSQSQDLDPDESGLSDYERTTRLRRRASKRSNHPPSSSPPSPTASSSSVDHTGLQLDCLSPSCSPTSSQEGTVRWHPTKTLELVKIPPSQRKENSIQCDILFGLPKAEVEELTCVMACKSKGMEDREKITNEDLERERETLLEKYRLRKAWRDEVKAWLSELRDEWKEERQGREKRRESRAGWVASKIDTAEDSAEVQRAKREKMLVDTPSEPNAQPSVAASRKQPTSETQPRAEVAPEVSEKDATAASPTDGVKQQGLEDDPEETDSRAQVARLLRPATPAMKRCSPPSSSPAPSSSASKKLKKRQDAIAALMATIVD